MFMYFLFRNLMNFVPGSVKLLREDQTAVTLSRRVRLIPGFGLSRHLQLVTEKAVGGAVPLAGPNWP
jgi:hypothetical protein